MSKLDQLIKFQKFNKAYKDLVSTFNQSTLRRTTTSQAAKNILLGLETRIEKYKSNPKLDAKQLTQLNNNTLLEQCFYRQ